MSRQAMAIPFRWKVPRGCTSLHAQGRNNEFQISRRKTIMTQTDPNAPFVGQQQDYREEFQVMGDQLATTMKRLFHEGNVRRITIKHDEQTVMEIPLTVGVV